MTRRPRASRVAGKKETRADGPVQSESARRFLEAPRIAEMDPTNREAILQELVEHHASAGSLLLEQDRANGQLWFLVDGAAAVERVRPDGKVEVVVKLSAPSVFGTTSFFSPRLPAFSVRAASSALLLVLDQAGYQRLRDQHPRAAEALAVATLRVLSERFDDLYRVFSDSMNDHSDDHPKVTEWAGFRARLFDEQGF